MIESPTRWVRQYVESLMLHPIILCVMGLILLYLKNNNNMNLDTQDELTKPDIQHEFTKWLSDFGWDYFVTITFKKPYSDVNVNRKMDYISNHYLIERILWFREFTSDGKPHVHMIIKSEKTIKGFQKLHREFKRYGHIDFQMFDKYKSSNCIGYISKQMKYDKEVLWNIK
jgi:hypothetical protein